MPFRFTIRDLLWLTLVVALATGWWLDHQRDAAQNQPAASLLLLKNTLADDVAKQLSAAFAGASEVRFSADWRRNAIDLECPLQQQKGIEELIKKLDRLPVDSRDSL